MHLKMMTSMGGPDLSIANGDEIPFDETFPFDAAEVHRFRANEIAVFVGTEEEIAAWLKANPSDEPADATPAPEGKDAADSTKAAADAAKGHAPAGKPAGKPATGAAAKKA